MLATVATAEGPHEVATSSNGRWAVVTNYGVPGEPGNSLTVIDLETSPSHEPSTSGNISVLTASHFPRVIRCC